MEFIDDVKENGDVKYISIPVKICRLLKINKGDIVQIIIKKVSIEEEETL